MKKIYGIVFSAAFSSVIIFNSVFFSLSSCAHRFNLSKIEFSSYELKDSIVKDDSAAIAEIAPYKVKLDETMSQVLNNSEVAMTKDLPEGLLGNFVADLILKKTNDYYKPADGKKVQICILNNGGLRTSLPRGEITRGKVFELMPFENELSIVTISGNNSAQLFEYLAKTGGTPVAGIKMGIENSMPVQLFVHGEPFDSTKSYKVVTSDYLANGGDKYFFFKEPLKREDLGVKVRDAIIEFIVEEKQKGKTLNSQFDGRIYYVH